MPERGFSFTEAKSFKDGAAICWEYAKRAAVEKRRPFDRKPMDCSGLPRAFGKDMPKEDADAITASCHLADALGSRLAGERPDNGPRPAIEWADFDGPLLVFGREIKGEARPSYTAFLVIRALLDVFPYGATKDDIESVASTARRLMEDLKRGNTLWDKALIMPGQKGQGGYRIAPSNIE